MKVCHIRKNEEESYFAITQRQVTKKFHPQLMGVHFMIGNALIIRAENEKRVITLPYEDIVQCAVPTKREVGLLYMQRMTCTMSVYRVHSTNIDEGRFGAAEMTSRRTPLFLITVMLCDDLACTGRDPIGRTRRK